MPKTMGKHEDFPKDVLDKNFGRVPFPEILKVRLLSTEWNRNFRTVVSQASRALPTYCPLYILKVMSRSGRRQIGDGSTWRRIGYDCAEGRFKKLGKIDGSKKTVNPGLFSSRCGALLVQVVFQEHGALATVINQVTCQRNLVWFSNLEEIMLQPMVSSVGAEHYEIIICHFSRSSSVNFSVTVYNSVFKDHTTRSYIFDRAINIFCARSAYNDGVLYLPKSISAYMEQDVKVSQLNIKNGAINEITVWRNAGSRYVFPAVLLCGSRVMCVLVSIYWNGPPIARVFHVDPVSSESIAVSTYEIEHFPTELNIGKNNFASSRDSIFITIRETKICKFLVDPCPDLGVQRASRYRTVRYDVDANVWTSIDTPFCKFPTEEERRMEVEPFAFEPGLNPLASP